MLKTFKLACIGLASVFVISAAEAAPIAPISGIDSLTVPVAGGCGPGRWRGPWGGCRSTPYYGRLPGGWYQPAPHPIFGCPPGYWHGPWGHCRDTPYHGRLPGGGWQ